MRLRNGQLSPRYALSMTGGTISFANMIHTSERLNRRNQNVDLYDSSSNYVFRRFAEHRPAPSGDEPTRGYDAVSLLPSYRLCGACYKRNRPASLPMVND